MLSNAFFTILWLHSKVQIKLHFLFHLVIRILQDGEELSCSKLADLTLRRRCCQLGSRDKGSLLQRKDYCQRYSSLTKNLDCCCRKTWLALAESNQAAEKVWVDLVSEEVEGGDVVVVDHVLAVVRVVLVQLLADPIQQLLELGQRGVGGVNINPVLDHLKGRNLVSQKLFLSSPFHRTHTGYPLHSEAGLPECHHRPGGRMTKVVFLP